MTPSRPDAACYLPLVVCLGLLCQAAAAGCNQDGVTQTNRPSSPEHRQLAILVSGDTAGWIVPCGCTSNQSGGLLRRGTFVRQAREQYQVVLLDAGGAPAGSSPYEKAKFEAIVNGETQMGVAAHNLGGPEAALGADYLRRAVAEGKAPFISANLSDGQGTPIAEAYRIVAAGGRRIAIVGVLSQDYATPELRISEPRAAVLAVREAIREPFDWLVVLAYLPEEELREFAASLPEADLVIGGPTGQSIAPTPVGPALLASATNKGKFLVSLLAPDGKRRVRWEGSVAEMTAELPDDAAQQRNLDDFRAKLAELDLTAVESGLTGMTLGQLPASYRVAGSEACRDCHAKDWDVWQASTHAHGWESLVRQGAHVDSYCQQCHSTGFGLPGGFASARRSPQRVGIGCESCHGPSSAHAETPTLRTPWTARDRCLQCHDRENSPEFEFAAYWESIVHGESASAAEPAASPLPPARESPR